MEKPTGALSLVFRQKKDGTTYAAKQYYKLPLQVMRTHYQENDGTAYVYLLNPSGGVLQHDRLYTEIVLEENSRVYITTPSSTKFYKMDEGHAEVVNQITVGAGAVLEYLPEHNTPFAMAKAFQENEFHLHKDAVLIASDMVTAGRVSRGEIFAYDLYSSKTKIYVDGRLCLYDHSRMDAGNMDMSKLGYMEGYLTNGAIYARAPHIKDSLPKAINQMKPEGVVLAAGKIDDSLMIVRFLGNSMVELKETAETVWGKIRREILGKEPIRVRKY